MVRRAGGRAGGLRRDARFGSVGRQRRSAPCHAAARHPGFASRHEQRGCGQALGCPPHSTAQAAACSLRGAREGAGAMGAACDGEVCAADAVSAAPHLRRENAVVGRGHGCGQRTRAMVSREGASARVIVVGYVGFRTLPSTRGYPEAGPPTPPLSAPRGRARRCAPAPSGGGGALLSEKLGTPRRGSSCRQQRATQAPNNRRRPTSYRKTGLVGKCVLRCTHRSPTNEL